MLSASKWFKQLSQRKTNSYISTTQFKACLNCQICRLIGEPEKGNRTLWVDKFVDGWLVTSSHALRTRRHHQHTIFITTIWHNPFLTVMNTSIGTYQSVATQASPSELTYEFLNQILLAIENDPISAKDICTPYIENLCKDGNLSIAARLLQSLRDKHIYLIANACDLLLAAAGEGNDIGLVSQIFKDLLVFGEPISSIAYVNLAKASTITNDSFLLLGFIKEVSELIFPRSATVVNRIILAFAECGQIDI